MNKIVNYIQKVALSSMKYLMPAIQIFKIYTLCIDLKFFLQEAIREERKKRVVPAPREGLHVVIILPDGDRIGRYFDQDAFFQVGILIK